MSSSGTLPDRSPIPVTETWTVPTPCDDGGERVRDTEPEVHVEVRLERLRDPLLDLPHHERGRAAGEHAEGVDEDEPVHVPVALDRLDQVEELADVGPGRVDREEDDLEPVLVRELVDSTVASIARS